MIYQFNRLGPYISYNNDYNSDFDFGYSPPVSSQKAVDFGFEPGADRPFAEHFHHPSLYGYQPAPPPSDSSSSGMTGVFSGSSSFRMPFQFPSQPPVDKRFKTLPPTEALPHNEPLGGYIFVCNNDTMEENLKRQLFGLPQRYRDSVRAIQPGLPLFLYNYTTHQLHGVFEAAGFGGSNIDPSAWEDKKCPGESRFPAQVRTRVRKRFQALDEGDFRPVLHHYDGPKFRLQLCVPEVLALLDLFIEKDSPETPPVKESRTEEAPRPPQASAEGKDTYST